MPRFSPFIEAIYFFDVNTKYTSPSVFKTSGFSRVKILMFSTHEMKYIWYLPKKVVFLFLFNFYIILFIGYMQCITHWKRRCRKCKNETFCKPKYFWYQNIPHVLDQNLPFSITNNKVMGVWSSEVKCIKWMENSEVLHSENIGWLFHFNFICFYIHWLNC